MLLSSLKRIAFQLLQRIAALRYRSSSGAGEPNCILVLQYMLPLGGCVHAAPLFEALESGLPVYIATRGIGLEVLRHSPHVAGLIGTPDPFTDFAGAGKALVAELHARALRPAWIITDASNRRSRIALLGSLFVGAPMIGFNLAEGLQAVALQRDPSLSMIENNLQIAGKLGFDASAREPRMYTSQDQMDEAAALLAELNPSGLPVVVFSTQPSGGQPTAWWPERWKDVVEAVAFRGMLPLFVGTAGQAAAIDQIRGLSEAHTATAAGRTGVGVLAALLAHSDLCLSIDTGTLHVARAVDLPCIALAPTFQNPVEWLPLHWNKARVLRGDGIHPAPPDYHVDEIESSSVIAATDDLLHAYPPSAESRRQRVQATLSTVDHLSL